MADAPPDAPGQFVEAPHDNAPQSISLGGPVIAAPKIVPIFFTGDTAVQGEVEMFLAALAGSSYWTAVTSEYGVGAMTIAPSIVTTDAPPTTDDALKTWIANNAGTHPGWPAPDANTIYTVFLPTGASLSTPFGSSCTAFGGYHDEGVQGTTKTIYALLPRCTTSLDDLTVALSHELVEASTDPYPFTQGAYQMTDDPHLIWSFIPGGELGDMCEYVGNAAQRLVGNFAVQRTWSNTSARAGHDPCVPALPLPFIGAAPLFTETLMLDPMDGTGPHPTKGVQVSSGQTKTIEIDVFSDQPAAAWTIKAIDAAALQGASELNLTLDQQTGQNGDKLHLTISRVTNGQNGGSEFVLSSRINDRSVSLWWGFVGN
jgi:hypothetical protein